ncbi:hypothetical protein QR97_02310 [Streptomyces sp. PBH53]|nr:hypothetical protein QR97_02310 [Streptomyces sp. PBH53]
MASISCTQASTSAFLMLRRRLLPHLGLRCLRMAISYCSRLISLTRRLLSQSAAHCRKVRFAWTGSGAAPEAVPSRIACA